MALNDFTGQNIQDTYQKVVQTEGNLFADGTGSALSIITANQTSSMTVATASYAISASVEITHEVSSSYAQTASMAANNFIVQGHITASGNISSSGNFIASQSLTFGAATAEIIAQEELQIKGAASTNDYLKLNDNAIHAFIDGAAIFTIQNTHSGGGGEGSIVFNASNKDVDVKMMHDDAVQALKIDASHNRVFLRDYITIGSGSAPAGEPNALTVNGSQNNIGHITSSGNISSSAYIYADRFYADNQIAINNDGTSIVVGNDNTYPIRIGKATNPISINGNITASRAISASGLISALAYNIIDTPIINQLTDVGGTTTNFIGNANNSTEIKGTNIKLDAPVTASGDISSSGNIDATRYFRSGVDLFSNPSFQGSVTASLNISASGDIIASTLIGTIDGGQF